MFFFTGLCLAAMAGCFIYHIAAHMYDLGTVTSLVTAFVAGSIVLAGGYIPNLFPSGALAMAISAKSVYRNTNPKNIGGMEREHYYAFPEDIATYPVALTPAFLTAALFGDLVTIPLADPFVMVEGKFFHKVPCIPEEGQVKSTLVGPTESRAFENMASFTNAGNNDALRGFLAYNANRPIILIMKELNGTMKVVGTQKYPALMDTVEATNGAKTTDGNIIKNSFKAMCEVPCPTYLAPVPLDPDEA